MLLFFKYIFFFSHFPSLTPPHPRNISSIFSVYSSYLIFFPRSSSCLCSFNMSSFFSPFPSLTPPPTFFLFLLCLYLLIPLFSLFIPTISFSFSVPPFVPVVLVYLFFFSPSPSLTPPHPSPNSSLSLCSFLFSHFLSPFLLLLFLFFLYIIFCLFYSS